MRLKNYLTALVLLSGTASYAQTATPYFTGFDNASQQAGWQQYRKGDIALSEWDYTTFGAFSAPNVLSHYYPVGGSVATLDWFVSPPFNFVNGGKIDSIRHHFAGFGTPAAGDSVAIFLLTGSQDPALATSKILLHDYTVNYTSDTIWHLDTGIVIPPTAGQCYIAFKYRTVNNWLDVFFDNIAISRQTGTGLAPVANGADVFEVYPNPARNNFTVHATKGNFDMAVTDLFGKLIYSDKNVAGKKQIDCSGFPEGIYFISVVDGETIYNQKLTIVK